jgi:methionine aminotransferase
MQYPESKLPDVGTTIFTVMSALAREHHAINLSQGFPDFNPDIRLVTALEDAMRKGANQYAPMGGLPALKEKLADKYNASYGCMLNPETEITITAGASQAIFTAIQAVVGAGDEVVMFAPAYDSYAPAVTMAGGKSVYCNLLAPEFKIVWSEMARLVNNNTKLIIINTPHNPSATLWAEDDLHKLEQLVESTNILLLFDEVYEHIVFDGAEHESSLKYPSLFERSFMISSFGKTYHTTGWKVGYCIAPAHLTNELRKVHQFNVFSVHTPAQHAYSYIMDYPELYSGLPEFYAQKRDYFVSGLAQTKFKLLKSRGTFFQLADYSAISDMDDVSFCRWLTKEAGVAAIPLSVFYGSKIDSKIIRFCFAKGEDTLHTALERLTRI